MTTAQFIAAVSAFAVVAGIALVNVRYRQEMKRRASLPLEVRMTLEREDNAVRQTFSF